MANWMPRTMFCLFLFAGVSAGAVDYYVAPGGNDADNGTILSPFATFEKARDSVRALKQAGGLPVGGVTVWVRGGTYERTNTFELASQDSGSVTSPIVYRAYPGETARIHGAKLIASEWFSVVSNTSPVWNRLDTNARGHVMQVDLPAHGITNYGSLKPRGFGSFSTIAAMELFFTNRPMQLARWPDVGESSSTVASYTNEVVILYGIPVPDVSGTYTNSGLQDGVHCFARVGLVGGKQYNLYRMTWPYDGAVYTAWFLSTQASGYPSASNSDPWWYVYAQDLNPMVAANGGVGEVSTFDPAGSVNGFVPVASTASSTKFNYAGTRPERWVQAEEPWFHGYWKYLYADFHVKAQSINTNTHTVTLATAPGSFGIEGFKPYYALNLLEEITTPGEWYVNRNTGMLYWWPPDDLDGREIFVSMLESPLWRLTNTQYVTLCDLSFEMTRGDLVAINGGSNNNVLHCVLKNAGNYAVKVSGSRNGVSSCEISWPGDGGVALVGGDRNTLTPASNYVHNCRISGFSRWSWTYTPAVFVQPGSVGHIISHNLIYDSPHTGILLSGEGNNHLIEWNEIHDVCKWAADAGAIYIGRDLGARGTIIRNNFIHHVASSFGGAGTHGIYLDDCISGIRVQGNICYNISDFGILHGGGRDNLMENNVLVKCGTGLGADARGIGWMMTRGSSITVWRALQALPYRGLIWSNAFPECAAIPTVWATVTNEGWMAPGGCVFSRNIGFSNARWVAEQDSAFTYYKEIADNITDSDPLFVDEGNLDLTLRTNSPAFTLSGFQDIPFRQIGLESSVAITKQPVSLTNNPGSAASFTVAASGSAPLFYQWQKNGTHIGAANGATYTISQVAAGDAADYHCIVSNMVNAVSSAVASLTVNEPAKIMTNPQSLIRNVGGTASFIVSASGTAPLFYQWQKNGAYIGAANGASYTINPVAASDAGNYRCLAANMVCTVTSDVAVLTVNAVTPITLPPSAPAGVLASDGIYTDKVLVIWPASSGAMRYEVWRSISNNITIGSNVATTATTTYDDLKAATMPGTILYYWVRAVNAGGASGFSTNDTGYVKPASGPTIKANGTVGDVSVNYPDAMSITIEMNEDPYAGAPVDWWVLALAGSSWYYLNNSVQWTLFDGNLSKCHPVYQGASCNLPATLLPALNIPGLPVSSYTFGFVVDAQMDGILNLDEQTMADSVNVTMLFALPAPRVKANGATGVVTVKYPDPVSITIEMNASAYAGLPADWWVLVYAGSSWYYWNSSMQWTSDGNLLHWRPVYQGNLCNLTSTPVLNISLPRGTYTFYFAVDYPKDGILNLEHIWVDEVTVNIR